MSFSFFWHDYETFGRVPRRDRPSQFAGVRTDADLNEIGEPLMQYCHPPLDTLPDPEACLLTGIVPQHALAHGLPETQFAQVIEQALALPGTVGVGYNTLRFDDEVTRHLFWRNLLDPYAREYKNECGRWDLLDVVRCTWALRPEGLSWPQHEDGRPSFKLEHLSAANGLLHEAAHDALSDVRATIGLARLIRQQQPKLWDFCLRLRHKQAVWDEIGVGRPFLHISGMYGTDRGCMAVVWPLAPHPTNRNELIVWDLAHDPTELMDLNAEAIRLRLFTRTEDLPEGITRLPIKTIHVNKSPVVIANLKILTGQRAAHWGIDLDAANRHAEIAARQGHTLAGIWPDVFDRGAQPTVDVDEDLYGGFIGPEDRRRLDRLRQAPQDTDLQRRASFDDPRLRELHFRWRARNFAASLDEAEQARWQQLRHERLHQGGAGGLTLQAFQAKIDELAETADDSQQALLEQLVDWAETIA